MPLTSLHLPAKVGSQDFLPFFGSESRTSNLFQKPIKRRLSYFPGIEQQRIIRSEQNSVSTDQLDDLPENPRIIEQWRGRRVIPDIFQIRPDSRVQFIERNRATPMSEDEFGVRRSLR